MDWTNVVNLEQLEFVADGRQPYRHEVALAAHGSKLGARKLGWNVSELPPGQFSCPYHFHHSEEELFLALEGRAMLRQAGRFREITRGDLIFCTTGPDGAHQFYNHSDAPFRYLALSTQDPLEVCEYPDSNKVRVMALRKNFPTGAEVDYQVGEQDPARAWPQELLRP